MIEALYVAQKRCKLFETGSVNTPIMKTISNLAFVFTVVALAAATSFSQPVQSTKSAVAPAYDAELAKKLGGNDNGMKTYILCILKTGPKDADVQGKEREDVFAGHMANIGRLAEEGKLAVAGPFGKNDRSYRGLYVFNVATVEEAEKLVMTDPAVKSGVLVPEMTPWFASASLMATPEIHKRITKPRP
jgi:uncharacterized protein YciI